MSGRAPDRAAAIGGERERAHAAGDRCHCTAARPTWCQSRIPGIAGGDQFWRAFVHQIPGRAELVVEAVDVLHC